MKVELISITKPVKPGLSDLTPQQLIIYIARVSNPSNQLNMLTGPKLLRYCVDHGHWSIFEQVEFTVEITTSRAIAAQILRHRSASFQEYSQRYAEVQAFEDIELRYQGINNKQGSQEVCSEDDIGDMQYDIKCAIDQCNTIYQNLLKRGVSRETARFILPLNTTTVLYMKNNVRNWLAYLNQRLHKDCQKEHRLIAEQIRDIFIEQFPEISECFDNFENAYNEKFM